MRKINSSNDGIGNSNSKARVGVKTGMKVKFFHEIGWNSGLKIAPMHKVCIGFFVLKKLVQKRKRRRLWKRK